MSCLALAIIALLCGAVCGALAMNQVWLEVEEQKRNGLRGNATRIYERMISKPLAVHQRPEQLQGVGFLPAPRDLRHRRLEDKMKLRNYFVNDVPKSGDYRPPDLQYVDRGANVIFDWLVEPGPGLTLSRYELLSRPFSEKTYGMSNMYMAGMLPPPQGFLVQSVHCFYGQMDEQDRETFRDRYSVSLVILQKRVWECPLKAIPYQGVTMPKWKDCPPDWPIQPNEMGETPRYIGSMMTFSMVLQGQPFRCNQGVKFLPLLNGYLDRAVQ